MKKCFCFSLILLLLSVHVAASSAQVDEQIGKAALDRASGALFEVVVPKPEDPVRYERPLPLDSVPYKQRVDKYIPLGTAFAIGPDQYVTAAHVLEIDRPTLWPGLAIRDGSGKVYPVRQVKKYSNRRDFVVFDVEGNPGATFLPPNTEPELNMKVYAVGNALGEGVVVRDGLLTSTTPEKVKGEWKWLRFSAAVSPGNSGGPLIDGNGRVIGLILQNSPNENLNIALPIAEILQAAPVAHLYLDRSFSVEPLGLRQQGFLEKEYKLPRGMEDLRAVMWDEVKKFKKGMFRTMREGNKNELFPDAAGSRKLLGVPNEQEFPQVFVKGSAGQWLLKQPGEIYENDLEANGFLRWSGPQDMQDVQYVQLRLPDDVPLQKVWQDSKLMMELILRAYTINRHLEQEKVRMLSLGEADTSVLHTDTWGRKWLLRSYALPALNLKLLAISLPVPRGLVTMMRIVHPSEAETCDRFELEILTDFVSVAYAGSLKQWREYLAMKELLPEGFARYAFRLDTTGEVTFSSPKFDFGCGEKALKVSQYTGMELWFAYTQEGKRVVLDVAQVMINDLQQSKAYMVRRYEKPDIAHGQDRLVEWENLVGERMPFDGAPLAVNGGTIVGKRLPVAAEAVTNAKALYAVFHYRGGEGSKEELAKAISTAMEGLKVHEDALMVKKE